MKASKILFILLILGVMIISPLIRPPVVVSLFPEEEKQVVVNIHGNNIHVIASVNFPIQLNVTWLDPNNQNNELIFNREFVTEDIIPISKSGFYSFTFFANEIVDVDIEGTGIPFLSLIYIAAVTVLYFINYIRVRFFTIIIEY